MRTQYFEAIRYRRWRELEDYAKRRPEQALADTIFQLVDTIGDKQDRKELKRILWILKQAGFEGRDYQEQPPAPKPKAVSAKLLAGGLSLSDAHGYCGILACVSRGQEADSIMALVNERWHFCDARALARVRTSAVFGAQKNWISGAPRLSAPVPPEYALFRIARVWRSRKYPKDLEAPPSPYWQKLLEQAPDAPHPAATMTAAKIDQDARRAYLARQTLIDHWRLTLPPEDEVWSDIHPIRWDAQLSGQEKENAIGEALCAHGERLLEDALPDLQQRLWDAAWVMHKSGGGDGELMLAIANDFDRRRMNSDFANWIVARTALDLSVNLEEDDFDPASSGDWGQLSARHRIEKPR